MHCVSAINMGPIIMERPTFAGSGFELHEYDPSAIFATAAIL